MTTEGQAASLTASHARIGAYARLAKVRFYYHWYPVVIAWLLLPSALITKGSAILVCALGVLTAASAAASGCALDDVQGFRDGLDQRTYEAGEALRDVRTKPLLTGEITVRAAERFGRLTLAVSLISAGAMVAIAPHRTILLLVVLVVSVLAAVQYSYGLKLSYHGLGEVLVAYTTAVTAVIPFLLITGTLPLHVLITAVLVGFWFIQIPVFSNTADAPKDRTVGRRTPATRLSDRANQIFISVVFATGAAITAVGFAGGWLPLWLLAGLAPAWALQVRQLQVGLAGRDPLHARLLGRQAFDAAILGLSVVLLLKDVL